MRIHEERDYQSMCRRAANILSAQVILKPESVLGLATGSSPLGVYQQLAEWYAKNDVDFSRVISINLDEYRGLSPDNDQSYRYFMEKNFFSHINIQSENTYLPNGLNADEQDECARYDGIIDRFGPMDIQVLGLGQNGHIGFNEPSDVFMRRTHLTDLTESTIKANRRFFEREEDVPRQAYTMGIEPIMQAKHVLLIVSGELKADIVKKAFSGPITPQVPASILQLHPNVTLVGDAAALSKL